MELSETVPYHTMLYHTTHTIVIVDASKVFVAVEGDVTSIERLTLLQKSFDTKRMSQYNALPDMHTIGPVEVVQCVRTGPLLAQARCPQCPSSSPGHVFDKHARL